MFEKTIGFLARAASPEQQSRLHADFARRLLAQHQAEMPDADVIRTVDGVQGASEYAVRPGGVIRYDFLRLNVLAEMAMREARRLSPVDSGKYRDAWFLMVDGRQVDRVPPGARRVVLVNDQPYHRKLEMTVNRARQSITLAPGIVERVRQTLLTKQRTLARSVDLEIQFVTLEGGYVLKGDGPARFASRTQVRKRQNRTIIKGVTRLKPRKDRVAGQQMTYPALVMEAKYG